MTVASRTTAHLLLQAEPGRALDVADHVSRLPHVVETSVTSGPYDVIAAVDVVGEELSSVLAHTRRAPGLARVCVCRLA